MPNLFDLSYGESDLVGKTGNILAVRVVNQARSRALVSHRFPQGLCGQVLRHTVLNRAAESHLSVCSRDQSSDALCSRLASRDMKAEHICPG